MKKLSLFFCAALFVFNAFAQTTPPEEQPCGQNLSATATISQRDLTEEEIAQSCDRFVTTDVAFYRLTPGCLNGLFSVASDNKGNVKYVRFSQGNLQYMPASVNGPAVWRFALHQYDYLGNANQYIALAADSLNENVYAEQWYDLFGFGTSGGQAADGTSYYPLMNSEVNADYPDVSLTGNNRQLDWGVHNPIFNGGNQPDLWRTLTNTEWTYLFNTRKDRYDGQRLLYFHCQVNGKNGMMLLPDNFMDPAGELGTKTATRGTCAYTAHKFTLEEFAELEALGVVFLPAGGYRQGSALDNVGSYGYYWSSVRNSAYYSYYCYFYSGYLYPASSYYSKRLGRSVRLVQDFIK